MKNSADLDATFHYYYHGQQFIELRNGSSQVLSQYVWGTQYVDELVQIGWNHDPMNASTGITENNCERFFAVMQDCRGYEAGEVIPNCANCFIFSLSLSC